MVITAADVAALPAIVPMLHKFNYVPIAQPILAGDVVRFVGEPIAAVVAPSREAAEDIAERVTSRSRRRRRSSMRWRRWRTMRRWCMAAPAAT